MTIEMAVDLLRSVLSTAMMLVVPVLGTAMVVGILVSLMQSITSIQEQTLTFVPKLVCVGLVVILSAHWMIRVMMEFATSCIQQIGSMGP